MYVPLSVIDLMTSVPAATTTELEIDKLFDIIEPIPKKHLEPMIEKPAILTPGPKNECSFTFESCAITTPAFISTLSSMVHPLSMIHPGKITHYHEALSITRGKRYILVSFNN